MVDEYELGVELEKREVLVHHSHEAVLFQHVRQSLVCLQKKTHTRARTHAEAATNQVGPCFVNRAGILKMCACSMPSRNMATPPTTTNDNEINIVAAAAPPPTTNKMKRETLDENQNSRKDKWKGEKKRRRRNKGENNNMSIYPATTKTRYSATTLLCTVVKHFLILHFRYVAGQYSEYVAFLKTSYSS